MSQIPADLLEFMETLRVPKGVNPADMLQRYDYLMNGNPPPVGSVHNDVLLREVAGWRVTADIAVPNGAGPHPVLVYFHGGGWTMGSPKTHLRVGREFAAAGYVTINVDYRRAPKHRFPAAFDDCFFATQWAVEHASQYGGDAQRLAVGGDSAGGNLAAAVIAESIRKGEPHIGVGVLIYGVFDYHKALSGIGSATADSQFYLPVEQYESLRGDIRVSPLYGCDQFPPCYIGVGTKDPLLPESLMLADHLKQAGVPHDLHVIEGAPHGFFQLTPLLAYAEGYERAISFMDRYLKKEGKG
ncbi:MAG: alpha/beta hydrolase [Candidatus Binatia bacterium]